MKNDDIKISKLYIKNILTKEVNNVGLHKPLDENAKIDIAKTFENTSAKNEYKQYIQYIISNDFDKKNKEFIDKAEQTVLDKLPKTKKSYFYTYVVLGFMFVLQIVILVLKFKIR